VYGSLSKEAIFLKAPVPILSEATPPPSPNNTAEPFLEEKTWALLKDSKDVHALQEFIQQFPAGRKRVRSRGTPRSPYSPPVTAHYSDARVRALAARHGIPLPTIINIATPDRHQPTKFDRYHTLLRSKAAVVNGMETAWQ
jgi:hypothetical protein